MTEKNSFYFSEEQDVKSDERIIDFTWGEIDLSFISDNGVFSKNHIDLGSKLLLEAFEAEMLELAREDYSKFEKLSSGKKLDLGTGYGVIGITAQKLFPKGSMLLSDVNERALALSEKNIARNLAFKTSTIKSDGFSKIKGKFDIILTNPPMRTGKEKVHELLSQAKDHLSDDGILLAVIGKKQGAESYGRYLNEIFPMTWTSLKKKGFTVFSCSKEADELD